MNDTIKEGAVSVRSHFLVRLVIVRKSCLLVCLLTCSHTFICLLVA